MDGDEGFDKATRLPFDLIILDVMLPRKSGFDVCRDIRQAGLITPVLMLTARGQTLDKVLGLKLGADDYLTKPFEMIELTARIEALLRRAPTKASDHQQVYHIGPLQVDVRGTSVTRDGKPVRLSAREFQLLRYLVEHQGATLYGASGTTIAVGLQSRAQAIDGRASRSYNSRARKVIVGSFAVGVNERVQEAQSQRREGKNVEKRACG